MKKDSVICWWSGGITSAVACKLAIEMYGKEACRVIMIDTGNEDDDTYRFRDDCAVWYDKPIESITGLKDLPGSEYMKLPREYYSIEDVWESYTALNNATGAICSTDLKRAVREAWQKSNPYTHQVFGFEFTKKEFNRALSLSMNHPKSKPIFPLLMMGYGKDDCLRIVNEAGIKVPVTYSSGFRNNNCFKTGCVQGGIGYWQKMRRDFPAKFKAMAEREHRLTDKNGSPVTMLKDQSNEAKELVKSTGVKWLAFVFLEKHPDYPDVKCLDDMKPQKVEPLFECNGFCSTNDLNPRNPTEKEINYQ